MKLSELKKNPNNPRLIKDEKFKKLVQSLQDFPQMMELRPIIINGDNMVLGGNMRLAALKELNYKEIPDNWVMKASDLTPEQQREFIIKDNVSFGAHDWDILANEWDSDQLEDWGLDIPNFENGIDYSEKNKEIDVDDYDDKMIIKLQYVEDEYHTVKDALLKIAATPEQAVYKLLGLENE